MYGVKMLQLFFFLFYSKKNDISAFCNYLFLSFL